MNIYRERPIVGIVKGHRNCAEIEGIKELTIKFKWLDGKDKGKTESMTAHHFNCLFDAL